jgi:type I restriction enzyme R subunit
MVNFLLDVSAKVRCTRKSLTKKQALKLNKIKKTLPSLAKMHAEKEVFRDIFEGKKLGNRVLKMSEWLKTSHDIFQDSRGTISRWFGEISNYFESRTTSGVIEGINNRLKLIKRSGYGFRNFENFYLGVADELREALKVYSQSGGKGDLTLDQQVAIGLLFAKLEIVEDIMAGFDYQPYSNANTRDKLNILKSAANYVADLQIKDRFLDAVTALSKIYALTAHHPEAIAQSEKISFFQAIQASLRKLEPTDGSLTNAEIETAIRQVVDQALVSDTVINIFDEAGIKSPDLSIISDEFLEEVEGMEHQNLAVELLKRLLRDEIKAQRRTNIVQSRRLTEMLEDSLRRYQNQVISVTDVIQELINLSKDVQAAKQRGEELGLEPYELAFYDALAQNQSARDVMGQDQLRELAIVLVARVRKNASIDWNLKESVRARMKVMVKRLLRQYGYPPDIQALAIELVLEQAKVFTEFEVETNRS